MSATGAKNYHLYQQKNVYTEKVSTFTGDAYQVLRFPAHLQWYLAHKETPPHMTLQWGWPRTL